MWRITGFRVAGLYGNPAADRIYGHSRVQHSVVLDPPLAMDHLPGMGKEAVETGGDVIEMESGVSVHMIQPGGEGLKNGGQGFCGIRQEGASWEPVDAGFDDTIFFQLLCSSGLGRVINPILFQPL